ncbi:MAG: BBP7 family outer membrane beta-barrel protein, partial [Planctomycetota bacterium]
DDSLTISSSTVEVTPATGTQIQFSDSILTENDFHGGQLGFETVLSHNKWMFSTLTKVHLGNMSQSVSISGTATETLAGNPPTSFDGGLLALDSAGQFERDSFAFIPEANVKLGYRFRDCVMFTLGYSFMYFSDVALSGDNISTAFDSTTRVTAGPFGQTPVQFSERGMYVQGLDLGLVIDF